MLEMQLQLLAEVFWAKLIRLGQIWLDLDKIGVKLKQNLGKSD